MDTHTHRTKLTPPRLHRRVLIRPALIARLFESLDYRLTLVQAGAGHGKTTALASLSMSDSRRCAWYSLDETDSDPQQFLSFLIQAFYLKWPDLSQAPWAVLQEAGSAGDSGQWMQVVDALINALTDALHEPAWLIVDDYHCVAASPKVNALIERFITLLPPNLHVILASCQPSDFPSLDSWRAKGQVMEIGQPELAFQPAEIDALFRNAYGMPLAPGQVAALADKTGGWPIALQLVWQGLRDDKGNSAALLAPDPATSGALFEHLAREVLDRQPPDVAEFLRDTAVLRELTPEAADAVTRSNGSAAMLERLHELDLFVIALGQGHYRHHQLWRDFLREHPDAEPEWTRERHRRAAKFFHARHDLEQAIYHWLAADDFGQAAAEIERAGDLYLRTGRLQTLATWIEAIPPHVRAEHPHLQAYLGDVYRLRGRFDQALAWYQQAELVWRARDEAAGISQALHGQAMVYLDTLHPAQAEDLLREAWRLVCRAEDRASRAQMLEQVAEQKLYMGRPHEAQALQAEARALRDEVPSEDTLSAHIKLRTGQLDEARRILEGWAQTERAAAGHDQAHPPRAHREAVLILSLIHSLQGQAEPALALAQAGIAIGELSDSPFVTAVGNIRLGHAWQLRSAPRPAEEGQGEGRDQAVRCYQTALALSDQLAVRRIRAEAMWGLTRAYGFLGDLESARRASQEGVKTGRWAGDPWITALTELMLGASSVLVGQTLEAIEILWRVLMAFRDCGDSFGRAATRLWLSLAYHELRQNEHLASCLQELLALCETRRYDYLLKARTLIGPPDPCRIVPLLIEARERHVRPTYAARLLAEIESPEFRDHPGHQLCA